MAIIKIGSNVRSKTSGTAGKVTERIVIEKGHQIEPPLNGPGKYEERVDLRVAYTDDHGNKAEVLIHESDAETA